MDFDFNDLSLDLDSRSPALEGLAPASSDVGSAGLADTGSAGAEDPLSTKLSLAQ